MNQNMTRNRLIARYRYFYDYVFQDFGDPATPCSFCWKKHIPFVWNMRNHHIVRLGRFSGPAKSSPPPPARSVTTQLHTPGQGMGGFLVMECRVVTLNTTLSESYVNTTFL
jgi:hypothetical protein